MTKIKNYQIDPDVRGSDKWIGSDSGNSFITKNFTPDGIASYFNNSQVVNVVNQLRFMYDTINVGEGRISGTFSFEYEVGDIVPFSSIDLLVFSKYAKSGYSVNEFMNSMIGQRILIQKTNQPNTFAYFEMISYEERITEPNFFDVSLSFISGNGYIETDNDYFVSLVSDIVVGDKNFVFTQSSSEQVWNVEHNLNKYPSVTVTLSTGQVGYGDVTYIDENNLKITFAGAESGKAYMN